MIITTKRFVVPPEPQPDIQHQVSRQLIESANSTHSKSSNVSDDAGALEEREDEGGEWYVIRYVCTYA